MPTLARLIFDYAHPKNIQSPFNLLEFQTTLQKISYFHLLVLEIQSTLESWDQIGHTHFWPCLTQNFRSTFTFCEFVWICKKWGCFINLFWRNSWFGNAAIWLAETVLVYISETSFMGYGNCAGTQQII